MTMLHLNLNLIEIKQSGCLGLPAANECFMADAESLHESGRWELKSTRGGV